MSFRRAAPARPARRRPAPGSLRVLLIALGLLIAQVPMLLHMLLVAHTTCEHGELVELSAPIGPGHAHAPGPVAKSAGKADAPAFVVDHADGRGHDHCNALAVRHRVPELPPCIAVASLRWIEPLALQGERGETRSVPLLSLAPKSSPPV